MKESQNTMFGSGRCHDLNRCVKGEHGETKLFGTLAQWNGTTIKFIKFNNATKLLLN